MLIFKKGDKVTTKENREGNHSMVVNYVDPSGYFVECTWFEENKSCRLVFLPDELIKWCDC